MSKPADAQSLLAKLVAFDTTSSKPNRASIDFIRDYLDGLKIRSEIIASDDGTKACLWATVGPDDKSGIVLAGHTDVVPVEGQNWSSDPFKLAEHDGKLYGRGACDMKGFIACVLSVIAEFAGRRLKQSVHLAFTYNEEVDMEGAARLTDHLRQRNIKPDWVWIGEPTLLHIVDAHKGVAAFATSITGVSGHSGQPDKGLNAIELGGRFIDIVGRAGDAKKNRPWPGSRFAPPYTTFNLGIIKGGTAENIIAEHCEILWQARAHPGDDIDIMLKEIEKTAAREINPRLAAFAPHAGMKTCTCFNIPPLSPTEGNPGRDILARFMGQKETEAVSFATEAGFFQKLGAPVVVCGPGSIEQAHQPNEYIEKTQLAAGADLLRRMLMETII